MRAPERIRPLLQPKPEIRMAMAITTAPAEPKITSATAVPTRPLGGKFDAACDGGGSRRIAGDRKDAQVSDIRERVEQDYESRAEGQRKRQIAAGIFYLGGGERDVVPRVHRKERADHGDAHESDRADPPGGIIGRIGVQRREACALRQKCVKFTSRAASVENQNAEKRPERRGCRFSQP